MKLACCSPSAAWGPSKTVISTIMYFFLKEHFHNCLNSDSTKPGSNSAYTPNPLLFCLGLMPSLDRPHVPSGSPLLHHHAGQLLKTYVTGRLETLGIHHWQPLMDFLSYSNVFVANYSLTFRND